MLRKCQEIRQTDLYQMVHAATDGKLLEQLAHTAPEPLLERIAEHYHATESLLKKLSSHVAAEVRSAVTENPRAPKALVMLLVSDPHPDVRFRIAENARSPLRALELLLEDENPYVAARAAQTLARVKGGLPTRLTLQAAEGAERTTGRVASLIGAGTGLFMPAHDKPESMGSEVRPVVPFMPMASKRIASQKKTPPAQAQKLRILIIEDNPADARLLEKSLSRWPFEMSCAESLSAGLAHLSREPADVVLLDLSLPDAQGIETFYLVHCQVPHVPVVVLTGLEDESVGSEAVQLGAQDYLVKGQVTPGLLARAIKYAVERHESETRIKELNESLERRVIQLAAANQDLERLTQAMANSSAQARDLLDRLAKVMYKENSGEEPPAPPAVTPKRAATAAEPVMVRKTTAARKNKS